MGYTHIARGASLLFNIELPLNFNHPFNADSISDFWRRWHIFSINMDPRLSLHSSWRVATRLIIYRPHAVHHHGVGWLMARRRMDLCSLGPLSRGFTCNQPLVRRRDEDAALEVGTANKGQSHLSFSLCSAHIFQRYAGFVVFRASNFSVALTVLEKVMQPAATMAELSSALAAQDYTFPVRLIALLCLCFGGTGGRSRFQ